MTKFVLDHEASDAASAGAVLHGTDSGQRWNGAAVPLVTLQQVRDYWHMLRTNDRNSVGPAPEEVTTDGDTLTFPLEGSDEPERLPMAGTDDDGANLYRWDGWLWVIVAE